MAEDGKLIDIKVDFSKMEGLADSAKILVKRISDELGAFTKPYHIRRLAHAKSDAALIEAETENKITEIQERALQRVVIEEGKRQANIESITALAIPYIKEDAQPDKIESDFISNFFDKSRLVSDMEMQQLWANLLAHESNAPGSVSKRAIALLSSLDKADAQIFTKFASSIWQVGILTSVVYDLESGPLADSGLYFSHLVHLDSLGLLSFEPTSGYGRKKLKKQSQFVYYGRVLNIEFPNDDFQLDIGNVLLSEVGKQLAVICGARASEEYYLHTVKHWYDQGYTLSSQVDLRGF